MPLADQRLMSWSRLTPPGGRRLRPRVRSTEPPSLEAKGEGEHEDAGGVAPAHAGSPEPSRNWAA